MKSLEREFQISCNSWDKINKRIIAQEAQQVFEYNLWKGLSTGLTCLLFIVFFVTKKTINPLENQALPLNEIQVLHARVIKVKKINNVHYYRIVKNNVDSF